MKYPKDLTGTRFGRLVAKEKVGSRGKSSLWSCVCDCGNTKDITRSSLIGKAATRSCGCLRLEHVANLADRHRKDWTGTTIGRLTVLGPLPDNPSRWECSCSCGNSHEISSQCLAQGTQSCGCLQKEIVSSLSRTHGMSGTPTHNSWEKMNGRCNNPNDDNYHNYGGRGISVCPQWLGSFEQFYKDMGERPEGLTLDRMDTEGDYTPDNCQWATDSWQGFNQRKRSTNKSGRTGVCLDPSNGKWRSNIVVDKKQIYLGDYENFQDAVDARERAELQYFGRIKQ